MRLKKPRALHAKDEKKERIICKNFWMNFANFHLNFQFSTKEFPSVCRSHSAS